MVYVVELCCPCWACGKPHSIVVQFKSRKVFQKYENVKYDNLLEEISQTMAKKNDNLECCIDDCIEAVKEIKDKSIIPDLVIVIDKNKNILKSEKKKIKIEQTTTTTTIENLLKQESLKE